MIHIINIARINIIYRKIWLHAKMQYTERNDNLARFMGYSLKKEFYCAKFVNLATQHKINSNLSNFTMTLYNVVVLSLSNLSFSISRCQAWLISNHCYETILRYYICENFNYANQSFWNPISKWVRSIDFSFICKVPFIN